MKTLRAWAGAFRHAWAIARATPVLSLLVVVALAAALALPLLAAAIAEGALAAVARIDAKPTVSIFLAPAAGPKERESIERALRRQPAVAAVRFIPRREALAQLSRVEGVGDLLAGLDANPLPDTFVATLADADPGTATAVGGRIRALPGVGAVQSDVAWVARLEAIARSIRWVAGLLGALMAVAVVAATFAAARLQALTHRQAITVATLLGATRAWVARPYLVHGLGQGTIAGAGAAGVVTLALGRHGTRPRADVPGGPHPCAPPGAALGRGGHPGRGGLGLAGAWLATRDLSSRPGVG